MSDTNLVAMTCASFAAQAGDVCVGSPKPNVMP